ncbi:MAG: hypothetical protein AB1635_12000 [Acidobacteriota bacterium]
MSRGATVKLFLKRGALIAAANWQVVLIQFVADAFFKTLLLVPVVGGTALVVLLVGADPVDLLDLDARRVVPELAAMLLAHPVALVSFLTAVGLVLVGGSILMFFVKGGALTILVEAEHAAGPIERPPLTGALIRRAGRFGLDRFTAGARRLFRRFFRLGVALGVVYALSIGGYLVVILAPPGDTEGSWTAAATLASAALVAWITLVNFVYLLFQIVMAADDCGLRRAAPRVARLLVRAPATVGLVFLAMLALVVLTWAGAILATAALGLIAFVPFVGLASLPLQLLAWLLRGAVFQYIGLTSAGAYLRAYRVHQGVADGVAAGALDEGGQPA